MEHKWRDEKAETGPLLPVEAKICYSGSLHAKHCSYILLAPIFCS